MKTEENSPLLKAYNDAVREMRKLLTDAVLIDQRIRQLQAAILALTALVKPSS